MQPTRRLILQYLKEHGQATVDELAQLLQLSPVTVRHHLDILRSDDLVSAPQIRHRTSPGRPQYAFSLTEKASAHFPKNYDSLMAKVLAEVKTSAPPQLVNVIFEGVAERFAAEASPIANGATLAMRVEQAVTFLNAHGYVATWEPTPVGYVVYTRNCPYEDLAPSHPELCQMDLTLVGNLLGVVPQRLQHLAKGDQSCAYLVTENKPEGNLPN